MFLGYDGGRGRRGMKMQTTMKDFYMSKSHYHKWETRRRYETEEVYIKWEDCPICGLTRRTDIYVPIMDVDRTADDSP